MGIIRLKKNDEKVQVELKPSLESVSTKKSNDPGV